jgi:hypothetical protein
MTLPSTVDRVPLHTADHVNARIERESADRIRWYADHRDEIDACLAELDREWDIERALEANAAAVSVTGLALGVFVDKRFLVVPAIVGGFLLQHALQGWCPPVPVFRRRGVRTQSEIERERCALKDLRGDFGRRATAAEAIHAASV